jgi:hypothetical protein
MFHENRAERNPRKAQQNRLFSAEHAHVGHREKP